MGLAAVSDICFEQSPKTTTVGSHPWRTRPQFGCMRPALGLLGAVIPAVFAAWFVLPPTGALAATVGSNPRALLAFSSPCLYLVLWLLDGPLCGTGLALLALSSLCLCLILWLLDGPLYDAGFGRAITDNILVAHEIVHTLHTSVSRSSQGAIFKLDMEKAFDRVEWPFLKAVMLRLGFAPSWVDLIMRCVSSVSSRVRVRGALSEAFRPQRGLRQGDPLSPFLFLLCTEGLSAALTAAQYEGRLPSVRASKHGPPVNHLLFADDNLVFLRNNMSEVHCLKDILSTYSTVSGQKVNFSKSTTYFSPRTLSAHRIAVHETLGVQEVDDPGIYLGVPLLIGKNKYAAFGRYCDKVDTRVSKWSNLLLSFSGSVKVNDDGAFLPSARLGVVGVIARDSSGAVLGGFAKPVPVHGPASTVEVSALFVGLEFAIANGWPSALIESDVVVLVNKLRRPTVDLSLLGDLLAPSRALIAASHGCLRVGFASRSANSAAHALTSWACHNDNVISFSSVCPELISRIVLDDL
ncbi:hypothetical protein GQ457_04G020260 [Hibiscus cannabinus]